MERDDRELVTIDALAAATGTTTRRIRSLQTLGLLPHPVLRGRTGVYGTVHRDRLAAILQLQERGFSLESLGVLFEAARAGRSLDAVLGLPEFVPASSSAGDTETDSADLYGFSELQPATSSAQRGRALLSVVPTTVWDETKAS